MRDIVIGAILLIFVGLPAQFGEHLAKVAHAYKAEMTRLEAGSGR